MSEAELTPTTISVPGVPTKVATGTRAPQRRPKFKDTWWRHLVAIGAIIIALFPIVYIVSSAFNTQNNLSSAQVIPTHVTLDNYVTAFSTKLGNHFGQALLNSLIIGGVTTSTLLTLVVVPVLYAYLDGWKERRRARRARAAAGRPLAGHHRRGRVGQHGRQRHPLGGDGGHLLRHPHAAHAFDPL